MLIVYLCVLWTATFGTLGALRVRCSSEQQCRLHGKFEFHGFGGIYCTCNPGFDGDCCHNDIDECVSSPCQHGGVCHDQPGNFTCSCLAGYTGRLCENDTNECASNPCQNGGACQDQPGHFTCRCMAGYSGRLCELDIDECASSPCQNGGRCHDGVNSYTCNCKTGFSGKRCEIDVNECSSHPCQNGGLCTNLIGNYTCTCKAGFVGHLCDRDINECGSNPCQHGGVCRDYPGHFTCSCPAGYTGTRCEQNVNECSSHPCQNRGLCTNLIGKYTCTCQVGFTGHICDRDINECGSNPCQHGGVCHDHPGHFTCSCPAGYTGTRCEQNVNECSSNPCQNGGVCSDLVGKYTCTCKAGFTGNNCDKAIDNCASAPCIYGLCHNSLHGYTCECRAGFTGTHCEGEIDECSSHPCQNGASCVDLFNGYKCECLEGDSGSNCEIAVHSYAPVVTMKEQVIVNEGTTELHIPCTVDGLPLPSVKWEAVGTRLPNNVQQKGHFLVLDNVTLADAGYYTCIATNRAGSDAKVIHIVVQAVDSKPYVAPVISAPSTVTVIYSTEAVLRCNVTGYPTPSVRWQYNQNIPNAQIHGSSLRIPNVTNESTGIYTCVATNDIGSSRANIMLETTYDSAKIMQGPHVYTGSTGKSHNFTCHVSGHPTPTITWTFTNFAHEPLPLPKHMSYHNNEIMELLIQSSGILVCNASNQFGKDTASAHIIAHDNGVERTMILCPGK